MTFRGKRKILLYGLVLCCLGTAARAGAHEAGGNVQDTVVIRFAPQYNMFMAKYRDNEAAIDTLTCLVRRCRQAIEAGEMKVRVLGFCSSYGSHKENLAAAKNRSNQVKSHFIIHEGLKEEHFRTVNSTKDWNGMTDVTAVVWLQGHDRTEAQSATAAEPTQQRPPVPELQEATETFPAPAVENHAECHKIASMPREAKAPKKSFAYRTAPPNYRWAVKTNLLYDAATLANIGIEYGFGRHWSVDLPFIYSPYTVARDYRLRVMAVQPELRYWLGKPLNGHFFGVHIHTGVFNISVDGQNRYQSPDGFYGAGLSYGYVLPFTRHWAAEFTVGAGYAYTEYEVYYNITDGARFGEGIPHHYWGLTRAGIGIVYRFGRQGRDGR